MVNKKTLVQIGSIATASALALGIAFPVFAQSAGVSASATTNIGDSKTTTSVNTTASAQVSTKKMTQMKARGDEEINRRVAGLNKLVTQVSAMKRITDAQKASLTGYLQSQVTALQSLKTKIDADTDGAVLKTDTQAITASYRIYALIIPQGQIISATDRLATLVDTMNTLGVKIQAQIGQAQAAGVDITAAQTAFTDYATKLSDANTQVQAAVSGVISLVPDQGDKTKMQQNDQALKDARAKIKVGEQDLKTARQDINAIAKALRTTKKAKVTASTTTTVR